MEALKAFEAGAYADALAALRFLEDSTAAAKMLDLRYYLGECCYQLGRYEDALEYYRKVYQADFPSPEFIDKARRRVFEIALAYLKERKTRTMLKVFQVASPDYGIDILLDPADGLVTENPYLSFADDAYMEVANYYFDQGQYAESVLLYDTIVKMSGSEWKELAEYKSALAEYLQVRGAVYDENKLLQARRRFKNYLQSFPRGEYWEEVRGKLREINELEGEKNLKIAKFYLKESELRACDIYLRVVLDNFPNSLAAREAREIRNQIEKTQNQ
jgi:tetratricopeptide (TPR) repeat protein